MLANWTGQFLTERSTVIKQILCEPNRSLDREQILTSVWFIVISKSPHSPQQVVGSELHHPLFYQTGYIVWSSWFVMLANLNDHSEFTTSQRVNCLAGFRHGTPQIPFAWVAPQALQKIGRGVQRVGSFVVAISSAGQVLATGKSTAGGKAAGEPRRKQIGTLTLGMFHAPWTATIVRAPGQVAERSPTHPSPPSPVSDQGVDPRREPPLLLEGSHGV